MPLNPMASSPQQGDVLPFTPTAVGIAADVTPPTSKMLYFRPYFLLTFRTVSMSTTSVKCDVLSNFHSRQSMIALVWLLVGLVKMADDVRVADQTQAKPPDVSALPLVPTATIRTRLGAPISIPPK